MNILKAYLNFNHWVFKVIIFSSVVFAFLFFLGRVKKEVAVEIVESDSIQDIFNYIAPDEYNAHTLVIFDLDNTLIYPETFHLGSDQWFHALLERFKKEGMSHQKAVDQTLAYYLQVMTHTWMKPVESTTVNTIHDLAKKGVTTVALTARSLDLIYRTIEQLDHLGIHFNGKGKSNCPIKYGRLKPAFYINGIIFCGDNDKGKTIIDWLAQARYRPHKIIFIDDKIKNIISVERAVHRHSYPFIGIRYGYLDKHIQTITPAIINEEYRQFIKKYPESRPIKRINAYGW